ncbi:hypothetical protein BZG36_00432 [Bifiguratus adelaidae]|uniref:Ketoreductase (KR) domain-containing protein n=1 Tax=Bifiguratus adelaidae TaxID=1938954 RepID=A0A261Y7R6_9FUNG|nr:hypothetical protein BZG36_00432 [Bifiguratus adelaidae]
MSSLSHPRKVVLITGASDGLGVDVAKKYSATGLTVVMAGRNKAKLETARKAVQSYAKLSDKDVSERLYMVIFDLSSLNSVRQGAQDFLDLNLPLNILINNAGLLCTEREFTEDSKVFEKTIMVNMVGPMLFTQLLLPRMSQTGGRILNLTSSLHDPASPTLAQPTVTDPDRLILPLDNLDGSKSWDRLSFYRASKLADVWWTYVLAERLANSNPKITVNTLCPGFVPTTSLARDSSLFSRLRMKYVMPWFSFAISADQSSNEYLAYGIDDKYANDNGCYYRYGKKTESSKESHDMVKAKTVWNLACDVIGMPEEKMQVSSALS